MHQCHSDNFTIANTHHTSPYSANLQVNNMT